MHKVMHLFVKYQLLPENKTLKDSWDQNQV